jgi:hypothetical protein
MSLLSDNRIRLLLLPLYHLVRPRVYSAVTSYSKGKKFHKNWYDDHATEGHSCTVQFSAMHNTNVGRDSVFSIATHYELDGPGIESRWGRDFQHSSRPALGPTQPPVQWVPGQSGRGMALNTHLDLAPRLKKEYGYTSTPPLCLHGLF